MKRTLLIFLGLALLLHAEDAGTNALVPSPTPEPSKELWGDEALPLAQESLKVWYQEKDPAKREILAQQVIEIANRAGHPEFAEEILAGKPLAQAEIPTPINGASLPLTTLKEWGFSKTQHGDDVVIRRIGLQNFELWTHTHGWLFNAQGELLNEAKVPRRDGRGREWYGAFLPNGQWITTDLWNRDDRIYLFSKESKLINSFPVGDIAGWGRANSTGRHWVAGISGDYGYHDGDDTTGGDLRISPWGWKQRLGHRLKHWHIPLPDQSWVFVEKVKSARNYVDPRELGSRGCYSLLKAESADRKSSVEYSETGHGRGVGWPSYDVQGPKQAWSHVIPRDEFGRGNYGFFPHSAFVWVGGDKYPSPPAKFRSWIFEPTGKAIGWLAAERLADDPDGKRMWFVDEQGRILKVAPDSVISEVLQPPLAGATGTDIPFPHVIFPDLKLGFFFTQPSHLILARWS